MSDPSGRPHRHIAKTLEATIRERLPAPQAQQLVRFATHYYARAPRELLEARDPMDLYGAALAHWDFARRRRPDESLVRVYNPSLEESGWESVHTVVEVVIEDMPFLVDSLCMGVNRSGLRVLSVIHPIIAVQRDEVGVLRSVPEPDQDRGQAGVREAFIHLEVERRTGKELLWGLQRRLLEALADLRSAVNDWQPMRQALNQVLEEIEQAPPPVAPEQLQESCAFLRWMGEHHFTFLGYRRYHLAGSAGSESLKIEPGSGLGILRERPGETASRGFACLPPQQRERATEPSLLLLTKANAEARVHRPGKLDYVGIRRIDPAGRVIGEHRFLGLYGSRAYSGVPQEIPVLRRKLAEVMERAGFAPNSHSFKALRHILESYPRDELFQIRSDELYRICSGILQLSEQQRPRLFLRQDLFDRFIVCLVFVPRERYDTRTRKRIQAILAEDLNGAEVEFSVSVSEATMARVLFTVRTPEGIPDYDARQIEARLVEAIHSWRDHLHGALLEHLGEERGSTLFQRFGDAFPAGYREDFTARAAVHDIEQLQALGERRELGLSLYRPLEAEPGRLRFKVFRHRRPLPLSQALPMLEHMGVRVEEERPYRVEPTAGEPLWVHDFGLAYAGPEAPQTSEVRRLFQDVFARVWDGTLSDDGFNALVLEAHLDWRRIGLLRAYAKYLRQTALTYSQAYMQEAMVANPQIARGLVELFEARFDPARPKQSQQRVTRLTIRIQEALEAVASLDHDRILRGFLALVQATLRSNYFQRGEDGAAKPVLALKLEPARIPDLPRPLPLYEIFVYSPRVEGVHLRGGKVARGGLRWSDRREDYRTEILGLMKAQLVKNAVIVPVGAKGGFVVKQPPQGGDRQALRREAEQGYRHFVAGLLDLTDNLREDHCVPPPRLVRYDGDDPYLVVAADKGTATFSDMANQVAAEYGFWLGDAFASGGRAGYDHKKMGITARGAWEAVRQHFHAAGIDYQREPFRVVGIGDMSGDVFGNGLLWSRRIRLLAAFDHRHIFLDPDPDPEASFDERRRLFQLPTSSWADYDPKLISAGGGVYARSLKSVPLSDQVRSALGIDAEALTPDDLIRALLKAPVELLWNGGIGTYVKAAGERNTEVGDRANDSLRIDASALRCRVVGEGGNLGLTQRARIEYAQGGGRIDTDFIHNAGGVNCSDHEVNIKILLDRVVVEGEMTPKQRDRLLLEMSDEVAGLVLQDSYWQSCAIGLDQARAAELLPLQGRFMGHLERAGQLDRALEFLPDDTALRKRQGTGQGLTRPELALLLSYAKHHLTQQLLKSDLPEDPCMRAELERYFPTPLRERFAERIHQHRLRREILAGSLSNRLINRLGSTFVFALQEELEVDAAHVARAYAAVWEIYGLAGIWSAMARLGTTLPDPLCMGLLLQAGRLAARACRWLLQHYDGHIRVAACIERYRPGVQSLARELPRLVDAGLQEELEDAAAPLLQAGVPEELAGRVVGLEPLYRSLDLVEVAEQGELAVEEAAQLYFGLGAELELGWLEHRCSALPRADRWHAAARSDLRDELQAQQRTLCTAVLQGAMDATSAQSKLEAWRRQQHGALKRYRRLLQDLKAQDEIDIAMLTVMLWELRSLAAAALPRQG